MAKKKEIYLYKKFNTNFGADGLIDSEVVETTNIFNIVDKYSCYIDYIVDELLPESYLRNLCLENKVKFMNNDWKDLQTLFNAGIEFYWEGDCYGIVIKKGLIVVDGWDQDTGNCYCESFKKMTKADITKETKRINKEKKQLDKYLSLMA